MAPKNKFYFKPLLFLLSIFFFLTTGEICIRVLGWAPKLLNQPYFTPAEDLPYLFTPNYHFHGINRTQEFTMDGHTNDQGFLDDNWTLEKPPHEKRIVFLGDSFTSGLARDKAIEYTNEVERQLKEQLGETKVNILNMGVGGFFPEPQRILLEKIGLSYSPDVVVVNFISNDILDTHHGIDAIKLGQSGLLRDRHEKALGHLGTQIYIHSHFCRWLLKILVLDRQRKKSQDNQDSFEEVYKIQGKYFKDWQKVFEEYQKINALCQQNQIPFFLVYFCQPLSWTEEYIHVEKHLQNFCQQNQIRFISTRKELNALSQKELIFFPKDGHYQDNANQVLANKVAAKLFDFFEKNP